MRTVSFHTLASMLILCSACGSSTPEVPAGNPTASTPQPAADATSAPPQEATEQASPSWGEQTCDGGILAHYQTLVSNGCNLKEGPSDLAMTYRVLRNAGFAAMGRKFKSPELTAAYSSELFCTGNGNSPYQPKHKDVSITLDAEKACIAKMKARENALRKNNQPPKAVDRYVLTHALGSVEWEARRIAGIDIMESSATVTHTPAGDDPGSWQIHFYTEWMEGEGEDAFKAESSTIISCDETGAECTEQMAG
jgi:hypothetical protein